MPATSLNVILFLLSLMRRALDFPKEKALFPPCCIWRMKKIQKPMMRTTGRM